LLVLIVAALAIVAGCRQATPVPAAPQPPRAAGAVDTSELDAFLRERYPADQPGVAVLIAKRGRPVFSAGYGLADMTTREPITPRTLFNVGSLSKTFVAAAVLLLAERGQLSLDDDLTKYFPDFAHPELAAKVRIHHLLTHTSGLPDNRDVGARKEFYLTARDVENWQPIKAATSLEFEPGSRFSYSNPAFNGLALIVEQVVGRRWQDFVHDEIFVPAGMTASTITDGPHPERGVAHGYEYEDGRWQEADYGEYPTFAAAGNGGVWSSLEDLARYEQALGAASFLRRETIDDARTIKTYPNWAEPWPPMLGYSWWIGHVGALGKVGHTGSQGGFRTLYTSYPSKEVLIVVLTNTPTDLNAINLTLHTWLAARNWLD